MLILLPWCGCQLDHVRLGIECANVPFLSGQRTRVLNKRVPMLLSSFSFVVSPSSNSQLPLNDIIISGWLYPAYCFLDWSWMAILCPHAAAAAAGACVCVVLSTVSTFILTLGCYELLRATESELLPPACLLRTKGETLPGSRDTLKLSC